ncbi:MAG: HigA family addiction module antidote protein [Dehalococcoidia bacterium]|nr:HigA family addiction module antidote protein [Dehalococcoidia bacterium]MXY72165.1 HigA family addiction module antidote protein [Dehalococcoidia bacterium]MYD29308.1 HigA family addiction module antidote protein [Dehalococcoidia bacterium]
MASALQAPPIETNVAIPPGEHLEEELEARGMTQRALAELLGRPPQMISEVIRAKKAVTADFALELEGALGIPAHVWMNLEANYRLAKARLEWQAGLAERDLPGLLAAVEAAASAAPGGADPPFISRVRRITGDPWRTIAKRLEGALRAGFLDVPDGDAAESNRDRVFVLSDRGRDLLRRSAP